MLNIADAPEDPIELLSWAVTQRERINDELDRLTADALFDARLENRFEEAVAASGLSYSRALRLTRNVNEQRGRQVRWRDALDGRSTFTG